MIQSHELPERVVEVGNVLKYRVDVQEVLVEDKVSYTYEELEFPTGMPVEICEAKVARHESVILATRLKTSKELALASITVTVNGKVFDGHESARNNMMSALMAAEVMGETSTNWKLADNTIATVTVAEVKEALALAIAAAGRVVLNA